MVFCLTAVELIHALKLTCLDHQEFQVPNLEVLPYKAALGAEDSHT